MKSTNMFEIDTVALVAPVTALEFLQESFLLTGEGPNLTVYSLHPQPKACASWSVLRHHRIHGIRPRCLVAEPEQRSSAGSHGEKNDDLGSASEPDVYDLAVFGGKALQLMRLHVDLQDREHLHLEILGSLIELQDWALDVRWLLGDSRSVLCVAVAHNSVLLLDADTGNALVQRSCMEGCLLYSALLLVHKSWADVVLVGGTVFNQLILWKPGGADKISDSEDKAPVERRLLGHTGVIFSISYLQDKGWLASASDDRSVRVWGVGDLGGPGGKCGDLNPTCFMVLYGHQARVFSVRLSPGKAFSGGEDGVCLVWDLIGSGKVVRMLKGHRAGGVRALAVSEGAGDEHRWVGTGGADGGVRLWRIEGAEDSEEKMEESVTEKISSLKFPGLGLPKVVCIAREENASWSQSRFVVCSDQGIVYQYTDGQWEMVWQGSPEFQSYCVMETVNVSVKDSPTKMNLCAVGNLSGSVYVFPISHSQCGILLSGGSGKIHNLIWQETKEILYLLASGNEGLVYRWRVNVNLKPNCSLSLNASPLPPFLLRPCAKCWLTAAVCFHSTSHGLLWVAGDRRGSLLLFQEDGKLNEKDINVKRLHKDSLTGRKRTGNERAEGEKNSSESEEEKGEGGELTLHPLSCLFGVHGKQGVTSVCEHRGLLYSSGRDGCVRIFKVCSAPADRAEDKSGQNRSGLQLEVLRVQRACKGMDWLEGVLILEPDTPAEEAVEDSDNHGKTQSLLEKLEVREKEEHEEQSFGGKEGKAENEAREARFVIVGFQGAHFVVWDPVRQERLLAVPCGGGHRSWSLWLPHKGLWPGYGALVFVKQGDVFTSQPPGETLSPAGKTERTGGWGMREGVHGRGIGCVVRLGSIRVTGNACDSEERGELKEEARNVEGEEGHWEIVVTGGEDTTLTVLAVHPHSGGVKVLSVITDHISCVRTVAAAARPEGGRESHSLSALLVSAGGRAQMQCYRLAINWDRQRLAPSCQVIQVASHRLDERWERRRNRHRMVKMDPETRYMSVVVVDGDTGCLLLAVACSDGAVRLFSVSEVTRQIQCLCEAFYHQRCVLSLATCTLEDGKGHRYKLLFSAATDGKIAVWDLTEASSMSAGPSSNAPAPLVPCFSIPAHQSGVNSLAVWVEKLGQQEGRCLVTVASGGDDGQLTVSTMRVQYPEDGNIGGSKEFTQVPGLQIPLQTQLQPHTRLRLHRHTQSHVPLAHAAPLTALKPLSPGLLVSTSPDQRVCLWKVNGTGIGRCGGLCSHVADASGLAVWEGQVIVGEEGDKKRERGLECEQGIAISRGKGSQTGSKEMCRTAVGETGRRTNQDREGGELTGTSSEIQDPVCVTRGEKGGEAASEPSNEMEMKSEMKKRKKTGWVLVCGQGLQLLRVTESDTEAEMWTTRREEEKSTMDQ